MLVNAKTWFQVFEDAGGYCRYCGEDLLYSFSAYSSATLDHVIARAAQGSDNPVNLVLACRACNGHLTRCKHLTDVDDRKAYALAQRKKGLPKYNSLVERHRPGKVPPRPETG